MIFGLKLNGSTLHERRIRVYRSSEQTDRKGKSCELPVITRLCVCECVNYELCVNYICKSYVKSTRVELL